jgi:enterochelin esterase-like enzyme
MGFLGLTSGYFSWLMIVAAVAGIAGVVAAWPAFARRRVRDVVGRIGLLTASQILAIVATLVFLNSYFLFIGSWSQLLGQRPSAPAQVRAGGRAGASRPIIVTGTDLGPAPGSGSVLPTGAEGAPAEHPPSWPGRAGSPGGAPGGVPGAPLASGPGAGPGFAAGLARKAGRLGEVLQVTLRGERTGIVTSDDYVYLPPQYFQREYSQTRFPVVLALTGYPGDAWSIVRWLAVPATAARLVAARKIPPAVYVLMNVSVAMPRDTECTNVPAGPQVESYFAQDVPEAVEQTFRVEAGGAGWAALGYSTGGYCAVKLAMLNPGRYCAAVSLAGYYTAVRDRTTGSLYGGSAAYRDENDLDWRLRHLPAPPVSVLVTSSRVGEKTYPGTLAFLRLVRPPMRGYSLILPQGGHNFRTWHRELPQSLEWLLARLAHPRAPAAPRAWRTSRG